MARLPREFLSGHDTSYDTIDALPANADHGEVAYVKSIDALCIYDAAATPVVYPTGACATGAWKALTPIISTAALLGTGTDTTVGLGTTPNWCVAFVGCLAIDPTTPKLWQCTGVTASLTQWSKVGLES